MDAFQPGQSVALHRDPLDVGTVRCQVNNAGPTLQALVPERGPVYEVTYPEGGTGWFFASELEAL